MDAHAPGADLREHDTLEAPAGNSVANRSGKSWPPCRIYRPARSVMQAGTRETRNWILEFEPATPLEIEPLMGWTASADPYATIRLEFPSCEAAVRHAERIGAHFRVKQPAPHRHRPKSYLETITGHPAQ